MEGNTRTGSRIQIKAVQKIPVNESPNGNLDVGAEKCDNSLAPLGHWTQEFIRTIGNCVIKSVGPVEDHGRQNTIIKIEPETTVD